MKSYLINNVEVNNEQSEPYLDEYDIPQGLVLVPLLFLIIYKWFTQCFQILSDMHHFADERNLVNSSKSLKDIKKKINLN